MSDDRELPEKVPAADVVLRDRLRAAGCAGPVWELVATELARYGWSVLSAWLRTGDIAVKCGRQGRAVVLPDRWTEEDRQDLVAATVYRGLLLFRAGILADRWQPEAGASLRTYFVGACVLAFPTELRGWRSGERRYRAAVTAVAAADGSMLADAVALVEARDALRVAIRDDPPRLRAIRQMSFDGHTPAEIAECLGITRGAVNTALHRLRRTAVTDQPQKSLGGGAR